MPRDASESLGKANSFIGGVNCFVSMKSQKHDRFLSTVTQSHERSTVPFVEITLGDGDAIRMKRATNLIGTNYQLPRTHLAALRFFTILRAKLPFFC